MNQPTRAAAPPTPLDTALAQARSGRNRRRMLWLLLLPVLAVGGYRLFDARRAASGPAIEYVGAPVTQGSLTVKVTATGTLEPLKQIDVGTELSGLVEEVLVDYNDTVSRDQVLARLDTQRIEATMVQARGSLAAAQGRLREVEATVIETRLKTARCAKLATRQMCSTDDLDATRAAFTRAEAAVASARAQVAVARATLEERETDLTKAVIRSPIDGIVLKRMIEPGQTVAAAMTTPVLFTLAENLTQMKLNVAVDEADVGTVRTGQAAHFTVDAYPARSFPAQVTQVRYAPETKDGVVTYATVLLVDNSDLALRPGMTATAEVVVEEIADAILVPNAALRFVPPPAPDKAASGGILSRLMMRWPARQVTARPAESSGSERQLWLLEGQTLRPVTVEIGATDEQLTVVKGDAVKPGMQVAVDYVQPGK